MLVYQRVPQVSVAIPFFQTDPNDNLHFLFITTSLQGYINIGHRSTESGFANTELVDFGPAHVSPGFIVELVGHTCHGQFLVILW